MRKTLLSLCAITLSMASSNAYADGKSLVDRTEYSLYSYDWQTQSYIKLDEPSLYDYTHYYYNAKGSLPLRNQVSASIVTTTTQKERRHCAYNGISVVHRALLPATPSLMSMTRTEILQKKSPSIRPPLTTMYADFENGVYKTKQAVDGEGNVTSRLIIF